MKVQKIEFHPSSVTIKKNEKENHSNTATIQASSYSPFAYRDFNINFTARLFRTPENFYAQPFNQNGMPDTMKAYLNDDYEDRKHMPPAQMLKLVFEDINDADSLDEVKKMYSAPNPEEPLFSSLTNTPNRKAKTGVLAEIDLMKREDISLFRNGEDNLGMYLLKKIYQEGKTLKEINTDVEKDISDYYKGISPIQYETLSAFGIKYPNNSFWKSLTATREEFPYEYKPRKAITSRNVEQTKQEKTAGKIQSKSTEKPKVEKKKFTPQDWVVDKLADAMIKGKGSKTRTREQIKRNNIKDEDTLNFTAKYLSEINAIVMRRLHISDEMRDYFENYEDLTKTQQEKFERYWKNPELSNQRSIIMKDTIKLFFNAYGADGHNEEFQDLLKYAHDIKPKRLARLQEHDRLQAEYERELAIYDTEPETAETKSIAEVEIEDDDEYDKIAQYQKLLEQAKKDFNVETYDFDTDQGRVTIVSNLKEALGESLQAEHVILPQNFLNNFIKFAKDNPISSNSYILTKLLNEKGINLPDDKRLMPAGEAENTTLVLYQEFTDKNSLENRAAQQAVTDAFIAMSKDEITPDLFRLGVFETSELYHRLEPNAKDFLRTQNSFINSKYNEYKKPLSDSEIRKITINIMELVRKYNPDNTIIKNPSPFQGFDSVIASLKYMLLNKSSHTNSFKDDIYKYVKEYGGSARFLLDKNIPESLRMGKMEQFMCNYAYDKPGELLTYAALNKEGLDYIKDHNYAMYDFLKNEILMKMHTFLGKNN